MGPLCCARRWSMYQKERDMNRRRKFEAPAKGRACLPFKTVLNKRSQGKSLDSFLEQMVVRNLMIGAVVPSRIGRSCVSAGFDGRRSLLPKMSALPRRRRDGEEQAGPGAQWP